MPADEARKLIVEALDQRPLPLRRRRHRPEPGDTPDGLPEEWRALLARWIARGGRSRWDTLTKDARAAHLQTAQSLLDWLLREGWVAVEEERRHGDWWPAWVELRHLPQLRAALGLPDKEAAERGWDALRARLALLGFDQAVARLDALPTARALARGDLLAALARWRDEERSGTRRDFALFARGKTKAVSEADWRWLDDTLDLGEYDIERHTPLLLLAAPMVLHTGQGRIDLGAAPDFSALTPTTIGAITRCEHPPARWRLLENRTSFERLAKSREPDTAVLWLPGFPPTWWREAVSRLLTLAPAPAEIACDPDPAGIEIACQAGKLWNEKHLDWKSWRMGMEELAALPTRSALTQHDEERLRRLASQPLPQPFPDLIRWMLDHGEKGEQEGFL